MRRMKKGLLAVMMLVCLCMFAANALAATTYDVNSADDLVTALNAARAGNADIVINMKANVDMTGKKLSTSTASYNKVVLNGNNKTISNLTDPLFNTCHVSNLTVKDLTIDHANINSTTDYGAVIVPYADCGDSLTVKNVKIFNSTVKSKKYAGAIYAFGGGYSISSDGPVYFDVLIEDCVVRDCTFESKGSVGSYIGHAACSEWTTIKIENCVAEDNTVTSTDDSKMKAGDLIGTNGVFTDEQPVVNGEKKTSGTFINATTKNNKVTSNGTEVHRVVGRAGSAGSNLTFTGGSYDTPREENSKFADKPEEDLMMMPTNKGEGGAFLEDQVVNGAGNAAVKDLPQTGDNSSLMIWTMMLCLCGAAFTAKKALVR